MTKSIVDEVIRRKLDEAADRYCEADKSDPFCRARVRLHLTPRFAHWFDDNGKLCTKMTSIASLANDEGKPGYYDCRPIYTKDGVHFIDRIRP